MKRRVGAVSEYCPHSPRRREHEFTGLYWIGAQFSIHVRDFESTLDGIVAYVVLFSLLLLSSFATLPTLGLAELYRDSLLRTGLVTAFAVLVILVYARFAAKRPVQFRLTNARASLVASLLAVLMWGVVWMLFGRFSRTYDLVLESARLGLVLLALCVGVLDGLIVYAYCTDRFVSGLGRTVGILISSMLGWLLFVAASVDFALYLLPIVVVLTYLDVSTRSPIGPTVATGLLLAFFYVCFGASPWMLGSRQTGYWLMTAVSVASALVAGSILRKAPLRGVSYGGSSAI